MSLGCGKPTAGATYGHKVAMTPRLMRGADFRNISHGGIRKIVANREAGSSQEWPD